MTQPADRRLLTEAAGNATYGTKAEVAEKADSATVDSLAADKLSKAEAAGIYATPSQVAGIVDPLVPPLVADALASSDAPAQAAAVAVDAYIAAQGRATETADGLMPATDKKLLGSLVDSSSNLIDLDVLDRGWVYPAGSGEPTANSSYGITPHIPVVAGEQFSWRGILRATYFDAAGQYIGFFSATPQGFEPGGESPLAPALAATARFSVQNTREAMAQMNLGTPLAPYEPGHPARLSDEFMPDINADPSTDTGNLVRVGSDGGLLVPPVTPTATTFFETSTNLIDLDTLTIGMGYVPAGATEPVPWPSGSVTDWIPLGPGVQFTVPNTEGGINRVSYFDANKEWIGDWSYGTSTTTRTTPAGTAFVRFGVVTVKAATAQANLGPTVLPYEPGHPGRIQAKHLPPAGSGRPSPILDIDVPRIYETHVVQPDMNAAINATTVASVYQMWDDLMAAHPDYITRTHMGDVTHGTDTWPMYRYDLKPFQVPTVGGQSADYPAPLHRIVVFPSLHGFERTPTWSMHRLAQAMCEDWSTNPAMEVLRFNTHLTVIPVPNPSGWTDGTRRNRAGVDLNRNFPADWVQGEPGSLTYGGTSPGSEQETQLLMSVIDEAGPTATAVIDFHSFLGIAGTQEDFLWTLPANELTLGINTAHIRRMERIWKKAWPDSFSPDPQVQSAGAVGPYTVGGGLARYAGSLGVPVSALFEHCERVWVDGVAGPLRTSQAATMGFEAWANYLLMILENWNKG